MKPFDDRLIEMREQMRIAIAKAGEESTKWNARKKLHETNHAGAAERRMAAKQDLEMNDALAGCKFHMEAAQTYAAAIQAEIHLKAYLEYLREVP